MNSSTFENTDTWTQRADINTQYSTTVGLHGRSKEERLQGLLRYARRYRQRTGVPPNWFGDLCDTLSNQGAAEKAGVNLSMSSNLPNTLRFSPSGIVIDLAQLALRAYMAEQITDPGFFPFCQIELFDELQHVVATDGIACLIGHTSVGTLLAIRGSDPLNQLSLPELSNDTARIYNHPLIAPRIQIAGAVNAYFDSSVDLVWSIILPQISVATGKIYIAGHGIGGAMATLLALRIAMQRAASTVSVVTFGSPAVGNRAFASSYDSLIESHLRVEIDDDIVPHFPLNPLLHKLIASPTTTISPFSQLDYSHVGRLQYLNTGPLIDGEMVFELDRDRRFRLFSLLSSRQPDKAMTDHSLGDNYIPRLQRLFAVAHERK